ncbi:sensor histidine kinase [Pleomorphovibrio marinus]|uniref:sensor histidine kinase n=1 Tax=Pleomorphovibrio marinus TaxID=2164132 RepID=UPI000E0C9BFC|nr:ATP-binding protein [Pleomorphovibrio marinus]
MDNKQQKKVIRKVVELNQELENYFRNTVIPQLFVDSDLILRKFTPPAMKHFRLTDSDIGRPISEATNRIRFPTIIDNIQEVIESNQDLEKEIQTTDLKWYQMNILPYIVQESAKTNGVIITFIDISPRIEILKQYERLNKNHETVIFALSHDLKGPIGNINGLIYLLRNNPENDSIDSDTLLESLSVSVGKLMKTIEDLTESIKDNSDLPLDAERVNIQHIVEDVRIGLSDQIFKSKAKINADYQVTEFNLSRKHIRSIVYNLINNAIKFSERNGEPEIWITTEDKNDSLLLTVRDNGPGIKRENHEMIFLPRMRLNKDVEGTGTGLFIVKRMVEELGGKIEVESTPGKGSIFRVFFRKEPASSEKPMKLPKIAYT